MRMFRLLFLFSFASCNVQPVSDNRTSAEGQSLIATSEENKLSTDNLNDDNLAAVSVGTASALERAKYNEFSDNYGTKPIENSCDQVPGDYDGDGDVDGRDFLLIQRGATPLPRVCPCIGSTTKGRLVVSGSGASKKYTVEHIYGIGDPDGTYTPIFDCDGLPAAFANVPYDSYYGINVTPLRLSFSANAKILDANLALYGGSIDSLAGKSLTFKGDYTFDSLATDPYNGIDPI